MAHGIAETAKSEFLRAGCRPKEEERRILFILKGLLRFRVKERSNIRGPRSRRGLR